MAEWNGLVEHCSNDLPVFVFEKQADGTYGFCFCCADLPSMEVINLPCCKASVHRHFVLEALKRNNQCVYCRKGMEPQDIIDCTPQQKAFSEDVGRSTVSGLKAPPEAKMSQEEVAANMNPPNIHFEPPIHDEVMHLHEKPVNGQERSFPACQLLAKKTTMDYCLHQHAPLVLMRTSSSSSQKRSVPTNGLMRASTTLESTSFFRQRCIIVDTTIRSPTKFLHKCNYSVPQPMTLMSYNSHDP